MSDDDKASYRYGDREIMMSKADAVAAENDRRLYGNAFISIDIDGNGKRLDPADVTIKKPQR